MASRLIVLGDSAVRNLLASLSKEEIIEFQGVIENSLRRVSVGEEGRYQAPPGVINRPEGQKILFRPFTSSEAVGTKIIVEPAPKEDSDGVKRRDALHGALVLLDATGIPTGLINAEEVTGYRTSLAALIPFVWRRCVKNIVIFGSGKQALWHIRLAIALRGKEIETITVVNRSASRAQDLIQQVESEAEKAGNAALKFQYVDTSNDASQVSLEDVLSTADVVCCTVPSTSPLFPPGYLLGPNARQRQPLVTAIGSWQPQMIEIDGRILQYAARDINAGAPEGAPRGAVIVDDRREVMVSSGEIIQSGLREEEITEIGEIDWRRKESQSRPKWEPEALSNLLRDGFLVYKNIGVSVTDLVSGEKILDLARKKGMGTLVSDFC